MLEPTPDSQAAPTGAAPLEVPRIELSIPAQSNWVRVARLTAAGVASRLNFSVDAVEDIKVAVSEAINNAIQHSPHDGSLPVVSIALEPSETGLWIEVSDGGRLSDELAIHDAKPHEIGDELPESGMGFLLIRSLMDRVEPKSGPHADTTIRMFKALPIRPMLAPQKSALETRWEKTSRP